MDKKGRQYLFIPKKRLGQNFLIDNRTLKKIVYHAEILPTETVLEIGPGFGTLTQIIQVKAQRVIAVEKDPVLAEFLQEKFKTNPKIKIIMGDILDYKLLEYDKVVATPPYNISSKLLFQLIQRNCRVIVLTFQKEFAERLVSKPGTKNYSRLSILTQYKSICKIIENIPNTKFYPIPKIDSSIVELIPRKNPPFKVKNELFYFNLIKNLFSHKRKKIKNNIMKYYNIKDDNLPYKNNRISELSPEKIALLSDFIYQITIERKLI